MHRYKREAAALRREVRFTYAKQFFACLVGAMALDMMVLAFREHGTGAFSTVIAVLNATALYCSLRLFILEIEIRRLAKSVLAKIARLETLL